MEGEGKGGRTTTDCVEARGLTADLGRTGGGRQRSDGVDVAAGGRGADRGGGPAGGVHRTGDSDPLRLSVLSLQLDRRRQVRPASPVSSLSA